MNPESEHYQPWADKQIVNAAKEKRPLADFLAEFDERLRASGPISEPVWEVDRNLRLLARFSSAPATPKKRRRRSRSGRGPTLAAPGEAATRPGRQRAPRAQPPASQGATPPPTAARRRRRRRRPRGGGGGAPGGAAATP